MVLVGHAPGAEALVHQLTDAATSSAESVAASQSRFPAATLAELEFEGEWSQLDSGSLVAVRPPGSARN